MHKKPVTIRAAMLGESKGNSKLYLRWITLKGKIKMLTRKSC